MSSITKYLSSYSNKYINSVGHKSYTDSKFITMSKSLDTKFNRTGGVMAGSIDTNNNNIKNISDPIEGADVVSKEYVVTSIEKINQNIESKMTGVKVFPPPAGPFDPINKRYLEILSQNMDDIDTHKLLHIAKTIKGELDPDDLKNKPFISTVHFMQSILEIYTGVFRNRGEDKNLQDLQYYRSLFVDVKFYIITIIEGSSEQFFIQLKQKLMDNALVFTPDERTIGKRYRMFINKRAKFIDRTRSSNQLELLIQKNFLLLDLGFIYLLDELLAELFNSENYPRFVYIHS